jgi:Ca2+-binding EF-hand superfamily protein
MKLLLTIALGVMAASTPALAQPAEAPPPGVAPAQPGPGTAIGRGGWMRDQTRAEAQQRADRIFQMLDANHDGVVTRAEAEEAASQFAARRGGGEGGNGRMERLIDREFGTAQSLTLQQFEAQALASFDALDLNHDGVVTAAERQQARAAMREQGTNRQ